MNEVFADAFYFLALLDQRDEHHKRVVAWASDYRGFFVTTRWVLGEVANALADSPIRAAGAKFLRLVAEDPSFQVIVNSDALYERGMALYEQRPDKEWSLTDCISFLVMEDEGLREALTGDRLSRRRGSRRCLLSRATGAERSQAVEGTVV